MPEGQQNLGNHVRRHPPFHFFAQPVLAITLLVTIGNAIRHPHLHAFGMVLLAAALVATLLLARFYALQVQDRVIRLEERLRLQELAPQLRSRIGEFSVKQLVALRFASDAELATLAPRTLTEKLEPKCIKAAITKWRRDYLRV